VRRRDWAAAFEAYALAREDSALSGDDLYAFGDAAWWLGRVDESIDLMQQAFPRFLDAGESRVAAVCALTVGYTLALRGDDVQASAWFQHGYELLSADSACVEYGYLIYIEFEEASNKGDIDRALERGHSMLDHVKQYGSTELNALATLSQGKLLILQGRLEDGFRLLDRAMLSAITDDMDPGWAGNIYCNMMVMCFNVLDLRRAAQWTKATLKWCAEQTSHGPFMGICQAHRANIMMAQGQLSEARDAIERVLSDPTGFDRRSIGEAHYERGELHRLHGEWDAAEESYRRATMYGREPQPGCSLLALARGDLQEARESIATALGDVFRDDPNRAPLLAAAVEIAVAAGDQETAQQSCDERARLAARYGTLGMRGLCAEARGMLYLAAGLDAEARTAFREACQTWLDAPSILASARCRALMSIAMRRAGQNVAADRELDAAIAAYRSLGLPEPSPPPLGRSPADAAPGGLTEREVDVLILVAEGMTNKEIGESLFISPRTVSRHLENIFDKLEISSRTAAAAYAIEHGLTRERAG
jgi:ATP/maltotriose-dependent transcriptional regulator MalT